MIPAYNKIHNRFKINGIHYSHAQLSDVAYSYIKEGEPFEKSIGNFLLDWLDEKAAIKVKTSGSTGRPKTINLQKQAMVNSAIATGDYFKLKPGDKALHCLPTEFIAGKMMLVRAMILGLDLSIVEPSSNPITTSKKYHFCAMVPLQAEKCIDKLSQIKTLIIGGASVSFNLQQKFQTLKTKVYATYGMTETMTHIAVKPLNKSHESLFQTLPNITITKDQRDCLVIEAPHLFEGSVITNDIVDITSDTSFEFLGRYDHVINSGGVKLFPEQIEEKLSPYIKQRFFITSEKDKTLGEKVVLVLEGESNTLPKSAFEALNTYEKPKTIYIVSKFIETTTGKVKRKETLSLAL